MEMKTKRGYMVKQVAEEIVAYCTTCKMDLTHVIEAVDRGRIIRVHCKTCKRQHAYKPPKGFNEPTVQGPTPKRSPAKRKTSKDLPVEWENWMEKNKEQPSKPYSLQGIFEEGDKIDHPKFGAGWVKRRFGENKMEVLFQEEMKILVCGSLKK
jgi:hypothetical protein